MTPGVKGDVGMAELNFPFWIVTQRRGLISKPVEPDGMPGFVAAFSSAEKAGSFMVSRGESGWENRLVARSTRRNRGPSDHRGGHQRGGAAGRWRPAPVHP